MTYTRPLAAHRYIAALLLAVSGLLLAARPARAQWTSDRLSSP